MKFIDALLARFQRSEPTGWQQTYAAEIEKIKAHAEADANDGRMATATN